MIGIENVSKTFFANGPREVRALNNINLQISPGKFTILIGTNGSGKSTLLNMLTGSEKPDTGKIFIDGVNIIPQPEYQRSKFIARIFQDPLMGTAPDLSVIDNFRLASLRTKAKSLTIGKTSGFRIFVQDKIAQLNMGLENKIDQLMGNLSGGQRQALTLIMAIMDESKLLLMDEPNAALDPYASQVILENAQKIIAHHNLCSIMVTHNLKDAVKYADHLIVIKNGMIQQDRQIINRSSLSVAELYSFME